MNDEDTPDFAGDALADFSRRMAAATPAPKDAPVEPDFAALANMVRDWQIEGTNVILDTTAIEYALRFAAGRQAARRPDSDGWQVAKELREAGHEAAALYVEAQIEALAAMSRQAAPQPEGGPFWGEPEHERNRMLDRIAALEAALCEIAAHATVVTQPAQYTLDDIYKMAQAALTTAGAGKGER